MASLPIQSEPILRGRLQDLDVGSLLSALRLGRQYLTLEVYDAAGECTGVVAVKAGRILSASVDGYTGTEAVRRLLQSRDAAEFRVLPQPAANTVEGEPLGTIEEITQAVSESGVRPLNAPKRVLEGILSEQLSVEDVLRALAFSRQHITLALSDAAGRPLGEVATKANKVLSARAGDLLDLPALRQLLRAPAGSSFILFAETESAAQLHPLGTLGEVLSRVTGSSIELPTPSNGLGRTTHALSSAQDSPQDPSVILSRAVELSAPDNAGSDPIPVLDGKLGDLDIPSILHVAGTSRQYTCLHIFDDQHNPLGVIHLKSGHVVRAQAQDVTGVEAVRRLLHCPRDFSFLVQRYPNASDVTSSIDTITNVLTRATVLPAPAPAAVTQLPFGRSKQRDAPSSTWIGGAVLGAGFVLLGGIATALVLRPPAQETSISPISTPHENLTSEVSVIAQRPAPQHEEPAAPPAKADTASATADAPKATVPPESSATPSRATIASLQAGLHQLGYDTGPIDGVLGQRTAAAIKAFQYVEHLTADGTLSAPTRAVLLRRISEP